MQTISRKGYVEFLNQEGEGKVEKWEDGVIKTICRKKHCVSSTRSWDQGCPELRALKDGEADVMESTNTDSDLKLVDNDETAL